MLWSDEQITGLVRPIPREIRDVAEEVIRRFSFDYSVWLTFDELGGRNRRDVALLKRARRLRLVDHRPRGATVGPGVWAMAPLLILLEGGPSALGRTRSAGGDEYKALVMDGWLAPE